MNITFTFCPSLHTVPLSYPTIPSNISTAPEDTNHDDFFRDLFESNYQILGFQIVVLVITFLLILPLTFYFIEVPDAYWNSWFLPVFSQLLSFLLQYESHINRNGTLLTQLNCTLVKVSTLSSLLEDRISHYFYLWLIIDKQTVFTCYLLSIHWKVYLLILPSCWVMSWRCLTGMRIPLWICRGQNYSMQFFGMITVFIVAFQCLFHSVFLTFR